MKTLKTFLTEAPEKTLKIEPLSAIRLLIDYYVHVYSPNKISNEMGDLEKIYKENFKKVIYDEWYEDYDEEEMKEYLDDSGLDPEKDWEDIFMDLDGENSDAIDNGTIEDFGLLPIDDTYHPVVQCIGKAWPMAPRNFSTNDQIEYQIESGKFGDYENGDGMLICFNSYKNGPGQMKSAAKEARLKVEKDKAWKMVPLKAIIEGVETLWLKEESLTPSAGLGKLLTDPKYGVSMDKKELNTLNTKGLDKYDIEWAKNFRKEYKRFL